MALISLGVRIGRLWGLGAVGVAAAAYGCGSSTGNDQNEPPLLGAGRGGAAGRVGVSAGTGAGAGASVGGSPASAGKSASGGAGETSAGRGGGVSGAGNVGTAGSGTAKGGNGGKGGAGGAGGASGSGTAGARNGGSGGGGEAGMTSGAGGEGGTRACNPNDTSIPFKERCLACATDTCGTCLCNDCTSNLETCQNTPGCQDIANCVIAAGCDSESCFCGTFGLTDCLNGQSNGPCKDVILNAPGGHEPSASDVSAGPAADAATAVGLCAVQSGPCATECP